MSDAEHLPATAAEMPDLLAEMQEQLSGPTLKKCIAYVMLARGDSYEMVKTATGYSKDTLAKIKRGDYQLPAGMVAILEDAESDKLTLVASKCVDAILEQPLENVSPATLMLTVGIAMDKRDKLRQGGRVRRNRDVYAMTDEQIEAEMRALEPELRRTEAFRVPAEAELDEGDT